MGIKTPKNYFRRRKLRMEMRELYTTNEHSKTRSCGKVRYATELDVKLAMAAVTKLRRGHEQRSKNVKRYYFCDHCNGYHLTSWARYPHNIEHKSTQNSSSYPQGINTSWSPIAFIEHVHYKWAYSVTKVYAHGEASTRNEAKQRVIDIVHNISPNIIPAILYFEQDDDIDLLYGHMVAGPEADITSERLSYMEHLNSRVRSYLFSQGFRFRKYDTRYPGVPDIVLPKHHVMIFTTPCLWHNNPECRRQRILPPQLLKIWQNEHRQEWELQQCAIAELRAQGWTVLTYWECYLTYTPKRVARLNTMKFNIERASRRYHKRAKRCKTQVGLAKLSPQTSQSRTSGI